MKIRQAIYSKSIAQKRKNFEILFLFLTFSLSFLIRIIGLRFSEPFLTYGDEFIILDPVFDMTLNQTLNPNNFARPDQILYIINFVYLNMISFIKTGHSFATTFEYDQYNYFVYSRIVIAVFGSLIPVVAYKIGKESTINFSIPAALLFAFFPLYVLYSHYIAPDIPITLFTMVIILFVMRYIRKRNNRDLYLATIFSAINTAEKYPGLISFGLVAFAIIWVQATSYKRPIISIVKDALIDCIKLFGIFILTLFLISPYLFLNYMTVIKGLAGEARSTHPGFYGLSWFGNMWFYLTTYIKYSNILVIPLLLSGIYGMISKRKYELLPCFYGLIYWICLSVLNKHMERYALPMYTFPLLMAAFGCAYLLHILKKRNIFRLSVMFLIGITTVSSLLNSLSISTRMTYADTRVAAMKYFEKVGITKSNSLYEGYTPFTPGKFRNIRISKINSKIKYIVLSSDMYARYYADPLRYPNEIQKYETIKQDYPLLTTFTPTPPVLPNDFFSWVDDLRYYYEKRIGRTTEQRTTGPVIQIYQVDKP